MNCTEPYPSARHPRFNSSIGYSFVVPFKRFCESILYLLANGRWVGEPLQCPGMSYKYIGKLKLRPCEGMLKLSQNAQVFFFLRMGLSRALYLVLFVFNFLIIQYRVLSTFHDTISIPLQFPWL